MKGSVISIITLVLSLLTCTLFRTEHFSINHKGNRDNHGYPGDTCSKDFCYAIIYKRMTHGNAETICLANDGDLPSFDRQDENQKVKNAVNYLRDGVDCIDER